MQQSNEDTSSNWYPSTVRRVRIPGTRIYISEQIFGALSQDQNNPLSRVSVANSSFSLDPFKGCPGRCAYCTVAGAVSDITIMPSANGQRLPVQLPSQPELLFPGEQLADALMQHPALIKDKSVISIGTGSTEPFLPEVEEHTWRIIETFFRNGYKNPFWLVTKLGIPDRIADTWADRAALLKKSGVSVMISVTYSGAPSWVEPYEGDRFRNLYLMKRAGVKISHHLRPIIPGINDSEDCMRRALDASLGTVEVVCVGGLRRDPGVDLAWHYIYGLDLRLLPAETRRKNLNNDYPEKARMYIADRGCGIPVVTRSSQAISYLLGIPEYNLYRYRPKDEECLLSIPIDIQQTVEATFRQSLPSIIQQIACAVGLRNVVVTREENKIIVNRELSYVEHRALIHAIGHSDILPQGDLE